MLLSKSHGCNMNINLIDLKGSFQTVKSHLLFSAFPFSSSFCNAIQLNYTDGYKTATD